jgi:DNA-binding NarL/FixJ family response regulator
MNILLVDDHTLFRQSLTQQLRSSFPGFEFKEASNGLEALQLLKSACVDLVILDVQMPKMDGITTLKKIKETTPEIKVIMLTQFDERVLVLYCLQLGANSFLLKNCNTRDAELTIRRVINEGSFHSPYVNSIIQQRLSDSSEWANLDLSPREFQILSFLKEGKVSHEIANILGLTRMTVESYRKSLLQKTKMKNVAELISLAYRTGILVTSKEN